MNSAPRVLIVGGGFGGLYAAKKLANQAVDVTVIDRTNHHLFQPLLYQVATAGLSPGDIAQPIRHILRNASNIKVVMATVEQIEPQQRVVRAAGKEYPYDYLIVAAGARHSYFGNNEWEVFAPGLKNLEDALELRRRILSAFEVAETTSDPAVRKAALTFVIIGAGPTGVELAGAISELAKRTLVNEFRQIQSEHAHIILLDAMPRILPTFAESLSASAVNQLNDLDVEVHTGKKVSAVTKDGVQLEQEFIAARTIIWAAGNAASPLAKQLGGEVDRQGRVLVDSDLTVPGHPEIQAIGDIACFTHQTGAPLPGVAPVAIQMGTHVARNVLAQIAGQPRQPFKYWDKGNMATIGRNRAVADLHFVRFGGFLAWLGWLFVHLLFLVGFKSQVQVLYQWVWAYFTYGRGARLIYGQFKPAIQRDEGEWGKE